LGAFPSKTFEFFEVKESKITVLPETSYYEGVLLAVYFEISADIVRHSRSVYSVLDWLGDVGGLFDALSIICRIIISSLTALIFQITPVQPTFRGQRKTKTPVESQTTTDKDGTIPIPNIKN